MSEMIQALKDSIKHWEDLRDGNDYRVGPEFCALCALFSGCTGCPVRKKTGRVGCAGTPYYDYVDNETDENAQKEVDFLKDLLIEELEKHPIVVITKEDDPPKRTSVFHMGDIVHRGDKGMGIVKGFTREGRGGSIGVEFFDWDKGHDLGLVISPGKKAKGGHGWWCDDYELTLVYRPA